MISNIDTRVRMNMVVNEAYFMKNETEEVVLSVVDLVSYARQIACGMVRLI